MSESAERVSATSEHTDRACPWCADAIDEGAPIAICAECKGVHHEHCWDDELGCATRKCPSAPLPKLGGEAARPRKRPKIEAAIAEEEAPTPGDDATAPAVSGEATEPPKKKKKKKKANPFIADRRLKPCFQCGVALDPEDMICPSCLAITSPDGLYHGPTTLLPQARNAFLLALFGLVCCGVIAGPIAYTRGAAAREQIRRDPRLTGDGLALAAMVIGAVDVIAFLLLFVMNLGRLSGKQ